MQKKWNEYQIIDTRQLVNKLPEDEREQYKFKVLFKNKALTDSVMMFSKADFKKYRENNDAFIVGKIRKRQKRYDVSEQVRNGTLLSYPPQSITIEELISKKQKKNIIGSATMEYPEFCEKLSDKNAYLVFNKDVNIGLFNEWSGTCGYPDNYLERDFVVPTTMVRNVQIEGAKPIGKERAEELRNIYKNTDSEYAKQRAWQNLETEGVSGYTIDNVCGMVGDFWKSNAVSYTDTAPILVNEDIETTLNEIEQANKEKNEEIER